jgi:hypothetical protein
MAIIGLKRRDEPGAIIQKAKEPRTSMDYQSSRRPAMECGGRILADAAKADGVRASMGGGTHQGKMAALDAGQTLEVKKGIEQ